MLEGEPFACATKTGDDFIRNEQDSILIADFSHQWEIVIGRNDHTTDSHDGFGDECRDRVCTFTKDRFFQGARRSLTDCLAWFQFSLKPIWIRCGNMNETFHRGTE